MSEVLSDGIIRRVAHYDSDGDTLIINSEQNVKSILDRNKAFQNDYTGYTPSKDMKWVASIPLVIIEEWMKEGVNIFNKNDAEAVRRKLNSSENRFLRTGLGNI